MSFEFNPPPSGGTWGSITGDLSDQSDLQSALDAKWTKGGDAGGGSTLSLGATDASPLQFISNNSAFLSVDFDQNEFRIIAPSGNLWADLPNGIIYDLDGVPMISSFERALLDANEVAMLTFDGNLLLKDSLGNDALNSNNRALIYPVLDGGNIAYNWEAEIFYAPDGARRLDLSVQEAYFNDQLRFKWKNDGLEVTPNLAVGSGINVGDATIHQNKGNATATYHKFTAGTTTGVSVNDGFDVGISAAGVAELRQRENLAISFFTNNTERMAIDASGRVTGLAQQTLPLTANDQFVTRRILNQAGAYLFNRKVYAMNSAAWITVQTNGAVSASDNTRRVTVNNVAGGALTNYIGAEDNQRGRIGNVRTSGQFGSTDFASKYRLYFHASGVQSRTDFSTDAFAVAMGTHVNSSFITTGGYVHVSETNNPAAVNYLFGFRVLAGAVTLFAKNGAGATSFSSTLATLTDIYDIGQFIVESDGAGGLTLYRNGVLLGTHTGAPTLVAGSTSVAYGWQTSSGSFREFIPQVIGVTWE